MNRNSSSVLLLSVPNMD